MVRKDTKPEKSSPRDETKRIHRHELESMGSQALTIRKESPLPAVKQTRPHRPPPGIGHERVTDLRQFYNISFVFTLQRSLWTFVLVFLAWTGYVLAFGLQEVNLPGGQENTISLLLVLRVLTLLPILVVCYWELYRGLIELRIEGFRLTMITGVFLKFYDSRAICPITSVAVLQTNWDRAFNVFHIEFRAGPTPPEQGPLVIPALSEEDALRLEQYFSTQLSRLSAPSSDALADDETIKVPLDEDEF